MLRKIAAFRSNLPLIGQLLAVVCFAMLVAVAVMLIVSTRQEAEEAHNDLQAELTKELETLPATLAETVVLGDYATLQRTLDHYVARPSVASAEYLDASGARLRSMDSQQELDAPKWFVAVFGFKDLSGNRTLQVGGRTYGNLTISLTGHFAAERAWQHLKSHFAILLLAVLLDFVGIWLVLRSALAPLKELEEGANAIAKGDMSVRLIPRGSAELRHLMLSFERMANSMVLAQADLKQSEERLQLAINGANDGIWDWDLKTNALYLSPKWKQILGYADDELPNRFASFEDGIHPDDKPRVMEYVTRYLSGDVPVYAIEFRMRHKDGSWRWIFARGEALRDASGKPYRMAGSHTDITERKMSEQALRESEQRWSFAIEGAGDGVWDWDVPAGKVVFSRRWFEIQGFEPEDIGNDISNWEKLVHPDDLEKINAALQAHFEGKTPSFSCEHRVRHKNGQYKWILGRGMVVSWDDEGRPLRIIGTHSDITERIEAAEAMQHAKELAEKTAVAKSEFLANMSHEIRTPMNGIIGLTQLALNMSASDELRDYLNKIYGSSQSLLGILNDILDFSKLEAGRMAIENTVFELDSVLDNLRNMFEERARARQLDFKIVAGGNVPRALIGDPLRIQQILSNLLGNAIKFTERGQVVLKVAVKQEEGSQAQLRFSVEDTGIGIDLAQVDTLFQPFSQVDGSITRRFGGTGLGLAISQNLLRLMGGEFEVSSKPGIGSIFSFDLLLGIAVQEKGSLYERRRTNFEEGSLGSRLDQIGQDLRGARILVAEDNRINQIVVSQFLRLSGMEVTIANNGREVLDWLSKEKFDAILMDVHMPEMDGIEATVSIRARKEFSDLPIIALTAGVTEEERAGCLEGGMNDFIAKPVNPENLIKILSKWLNKSTQYQFDASRGE